MIPNIGSEALVPSLIFTALIIDFLVSTLASINFSFEPDGSKERNNEIKNYGNKALSFASITFAVIAFLLGEYQSNISAIQSELYLLGSGFGLFVIALKLGTLAGLRRLFWNLQQKSFNYGFLSLVAAIGIYFYGFLDNQLAVTLFLLAIIVLHLVETVMDIVQLRTYERQCDYSLIQASKERLKSYFNKLEIF